MKDLYAVLGIRRNASREDIEVAYAKLVYEAQVAQGPDSAARLAELKEAYSVVRDPGARDIYDQSLRMAGSGGSGGEDPPAHAATSTTAMPAGVGQSRRFPVFWVSLAVVILGGGFLTYANSGKEQERLRLQREQEIHFRAQQAEQERKQREVESKQAQEERQRRQEIENLERNNRMESERALREQDQRLETDRRQAEWQKEREAQAAAQKERELEYQKQREQAQIQNQLERYRQELRRPPGY
jgi:curved DNA-binding protein CbpA